MPGFKPELFVMHSFSRGSTIDASAWEHGVDKEVMKLHSRWRSDATGKYLQAPIEIRLRLVSSLCDWFK